MKKMIVAVALALVAVSAGYADIVSCPTAALSYYVASFTTAANGCKIDDKVLYGFTDTLTGTASIAGVGITVEAITTAFDPGLGYSLTGFSVLSGSSLDLKLGFIIETRSGANLIKDVSLGFAGAQHSGDGSVTIGENDCVGGTFANPSLGTNCSTGNTIPNLVSLNVQNPGPPAEFFDMKFTTLTNRVGVFKDISVTGGTDGSASLSSFSQQFSETNVPDGGVTLMLLGSALVGLETLRRKLRV